MSGSRILVIDKKTLKFNVGDAQTPFFKYKDTKLGGLVDVVPPDLMLSEDKIIKTRRILDMGGSGDCFFIAANAAESAILSVQLVEPEVPDPAKLYDSLGLKNYTYAEDSHIVRVMSCYSYSLVVIREHEGACVFCQFGENSENTVYMFNDYPRHYMLFDQVKLRGSLYSYQQLEDMKRLPDLEVTSQIVELDPLPEVNQSESTFSDDPDDCYGEDVDLAYLYQYVDTRYTIRKSGFELTPADSKVYYKLRHNVFKTVFLNLLGIDSVEEKPFTSLGIDSNRTPDLLLNVSGSLVLVEFTVVKRFITSISTKQSQNKYAVEVEKAHEVYPQVHQFYPTLSLDEVNSGLPLEIFELSKILGKDVYSDPGLTFNDLQQSINSLEFNISELMPELLLNQDEYLPVVFKANVEKIDLPRPFPETVLKVGIKRQRDQNTFNLLRKNARALERQLKRTTYSAKFVFIVNIKHNRIYADVDSKGLQKNKLLSLIQNNSPDCLRYVQYVGSAMSDEEPFKILGTAGFNIGSNRAQKTTKSTDTEQFESYYRSKLYKCSMRKEMDTLIDHPLEVQAGKVESEYLKLLSEKRKHERALEYNKNWFILPCMTKAEPGLYSKLEIETGLPLTDRLIRQANPQKQEKIVNRSNNMELLDQNLVSVNKAFIKLLQTVGNDRKIGRKIKNLRTVEAVNSALPEGEFDADAVMAEVQNYQAAKKAMVKNVGEDTRKAYRNRISFTASYLKTNWPAEMEHFNGPKGKIKMCVDTPLEEMQNKVDTLLEALWQELPTQTVDDVFSNTEPHGNELKHILSQMKDMGDEVMEPLRHTQIMHDLQFISRLSYTILYYSNIKSNKEDFYFDNLGYKDAIVFVKGGKKILSNKKSRLFKFVVPISSNMSWLYSSPNTKLIHQGGVTYCVSPWQTWTFQMLKRTTELYFNFSNYFSCSYLESNLSLDVYKKFISAKVLNMFSQRRKVEVWYGFFRYLYLNSMATHTNVLELIEDMVDFEYDPYFSYCQKKFARRYVDIYEHAKKGEIFDMVTMSTIDNFDLCAEKFDECVFMTVAPFDRVNEHLRNLRSVLKLHKDVVGEFGTDPIEILRKTSVNVADDDYFEKLSSDDLMFDPKLSFCVGKFAGDFLSRVTTETHLSSEFNKITQQTYTNISTSKGLRSSGKNFWGDKGHDVVFSQQSMLDTVKDFLDDLPKTNSEYRHKLVNADESFRDKIGKLSSLSLEFDIKDKAQWKGSREIYVMSEVTKILQSPIEKFFKLLCAWTPNELIHKKSHVRPKFIHGQVFEFEASGDVNTFATLDCRKWAPKSNLWKYYFFVQGMSDHLPSEFVEYFMTVWSLMFRKRVRIQKAYVEMLKKNPETVDLVEVLTERGDGDFEFTMPYSFMMGIFNYLSSLMHAFSQLYFDAKIARPMGVTFNLLAHSDDSGGVIFSNSLEKNHLLFRQYEMYQKSLNHLMSKKKCALSNNFFEMISIMYANKRLIPMTHKFLANVSFEPKGKGWVDDISTIVSKVVEIFSNGGTMLQCYLTMLTMSEMIRKFYHIPRLKVLSKIPIAYGGVFNLHPIHMILLGADCQEVLLDVTESPGERNFRVNVGQSVFGEYFPGKGSPANYHIPYYKSHKLSGTFTTEEMDRLKLISGVIPNTTLGQVSGHYSRLRDPAYVYSLSGVDMCQIYVMTLFTKTMILSVRGEKSCDLRRLTTKYSVLKTLGLFSGESKKSLSTFHHYIKASEGIKLDLNDMDVVSKKTCKPLIYNTFQAVGLGLDFKTVNEIIAYRKDPDLHFMFPDKYRMETLVSWLKTNLQFEDDFILEDYLMKLSSKDMVRTRSSYCFIPSGISVDTVERFWTYINFYCTRRYFISSQKPQYFTVDQFKLWSSDYDTLKHMYLLVRTALRCPLKTETFELLKNNASCSGCSYKSQTKNMIDEIYRLRMTPSYSFLETELPFAVYTDPQKRAVNVWYGKAEFVLYSKFGTVEVSKRFGETYHIYTLPDPEVIDQLQFLLKNFLITRGMHEPDVVYSVNDSADYKLGFDDLNRPRLAYPGERCMMQVSSVVRIMNVNKTRLYKEEDKITLDGFTIDLEIYQNYDINERFYKEHNLDEISNLIFEEEKYLESGDARKFAQNLKTYELLQLDPTHADIGSIDDKYAPGELLGSERSLTRALVLADNMGIVSYRSTSKPDALDTSIFEGMSHKDIPVMDLVEQFSFARVTHKEKRLMEKIVNEASLEPDDTIILDKLVSKLGIKPTMNAITLTRAVFSNLVYKDVKHLSTAVLEDYLYVVTKAAVNTIDDKMRGKPEYECVGNKSQVYQQLAWAIEMDSSADVFSELLTKLCHRAQKTNSGRFWEERKVSLYAGLITPRSEYFKHLFEFNKATLNALKKDKYKKLSNIRQIRTALKSVHRNLARVSKKVAKRRKEGTELMESVPPLKDLEETNYFLDEDDDDFEDDMDAVMGGDDPENFQEREWPEDEDRYTGYIFNATDVKCATEDTLKSDFSNVDLYSPTLLTNYPWLGPSDVELVYVSGIPMYRTSYPGRLVTVSNINTMKSKPIARIEAKPIPVEVSDLLEENSPWAGKTKVERDIFKLESEEDVYDYQVKALENIGIRNPEGHSKNFFKLREVSGEEYFWNNLITGLNVKAFNKAGLVNKSLRRRSNVLPGFTGNLKDADIRAELDALFKNHSEEIISGNQCLTASSYKALVRSYRRIYRRTDNSNVKAYLIVLLSTMRDCVIGSQSDSWYLDCLLEAVDALEEDMDTGKSDKPPPPAKNIDRSYKHRNPYSKNIE